MKEIDISKYSIGVMIGRYNFDIYYKFKIYGKIKMYILNIEC